jgi:hypothetical protein
MKSFVMISFLFVCIYPLSFGKIINGYNTHIPEARKMLLNLQSMLTEDNYQGRSLFILEKNRLKVNLERVTTYILYYQLTEILLDRFSTIAPDLYHEIDVITDAAGRNTDVYVKFIPEEEMQISLTGTTDMSQTEEDKDACESEYGMHTVSVKIGVRSRALLQLAHEFGHIKYQIPHFASYVAYYQNHYGLCDETIQYIGHKRNDPSGKNAYAYEKRFWQQARLYYKTTGAKSPMALLREMRHFNFQVL